MKKINQSLISSIGKNEVRDICNEVVVPTLASYLDNDVVKRIPFLSDFIGLYKLGESYSDRQLVKKIMIFLTNVEGVTESDKKDLRLRLDADIKYRNRFVTELVDIIDKIVDHDKLNFLAKIFQALLKNKISIEEYFKFSQILNKCFLPDLITAGNLDSNKNLPDEICGSLFGAGILELGARTMSHQVSGIGGLANNVLMKYKLNTTGVRLIELIND